MLAHTQGDGGSVTPWLVLTVLLVVPVLALSGWWIVARADNPTRAAAPVEAVLAPVTRQDVRAETSVTVALGDAPGREAASGASGTVTSAPQVGTVLANGVEVLRVDDRPIRAMVSSAPPWRVLSLGDSGADVTRVQVYLEALGYDVGTADGVFGSRLRAAVVRFNIDAGLGKNLPTFDPATIVWVGPEPLSIAEALTPEGTAVGPGTVVVRGPARPDSVLVTEPQGGIATVGDFGTSAKLVLGGVAVAYVPGSGTVSAPADVVALRAALAPSTEGTARITSAEAREVAIVPASALVQGAGGTLCVYAGPGAEPVVVQPVGGGVASTQLPTDLELTQVLTNPGRVALDVPCGS